MAKITEEELLGSTPNPPKEIFRNKIGESTIFETRKTQTFHKKIIDENEDGTPKIEYPESGGILVYHKTFPYPEKGYRRDDIMQAVQFSKRLLMGWVRMFVFKPFVPAYVAMLFLPWKLKIKILERWFNIYNFSIDLFMSHYYLEERYYTPICRELNKGIAVFLKEIGVMPFIAERFALTLITFIEYDLFYRYCLGDTFGETSAKQLLDNPSREVARLANIVAERAESKRVGQKFNIFAKLLIFVLWIPKIKKAFKKAIKAMDFNKLPLDEADRYNVCRLMGYNYFGMTHEERLKRWPAEKHLYAIVELQ